jgi:hypothetical protein
MGCMYDIGLDQKVLVDKIPGIDVVGVDTANLCGRQDNITDLLTAKKGVNLLLVCKIQLAMGTGNQVGISLGCQASDQGRSNHAAVSGDIYFGLFVH